ncbi:hypothetical protein ACIA5C_35770 [Actinoplanes sp. NPDC051343]|uniref:hypothetical protein n=1 Tax=Actinoplanes sp. NPDC051343 TaxID=3363906 RepID=UPI0037B9305F
MRKITKRSVAIIAASLVAIGGGAAWATWTLIGDGSTAAAAESASQLSITAPATAEGGLAPGQAADIVFVVANPNKYPVTIGAVKLTGLTVTKASDATGTCAPTDILMPENANLTGASGLDVPKGPSSQGVRLKSAISMKQSAGDGCKGASFGITVHIDAHTPTTTTP